MGAESAQKPKWRRRAECRPDEILDAALAEFEARGFDAARVEDIAKRAGISKAGVYLYFDAKDAILRGLIEREVAPIARRIRMMAEAGGGDPAGSLRTLILAITTLVHDRRMFAVPRIVLSVAGRYPEIAAHYRKHVVEEALGAIKGLYHAGVDKGDFRECDPDIAARAIMGPVMLHGFFTHLLHGDPGLMKPSERAAAQADLLLGGLLAHPR